MKKRALLSALLIMACLCAPLGVAAATDNSIPITTEEELAAIRNDLNGKYHLARDIVLTENWKPLGYDANSAFTGTFDGKGHTIRGLSVKANNSSYTGLFGYSKGTVRNVTISESLVDAVTGSYDKMHTGMVVGYNDGGTVENCRVIAGTVCSTSHSFNDNHVGGVVGYSKGGAIRSCTNTLTKVMAQNVLTTSYNEFFVGGIVGAAIDTTVSKCQNSGDVLGGRTGGIVGWLSGGEVSMCYNMGAVSTQMVEKGYSGGVVGHAENATVRNVYSIGTVTAKTAVVAAGGGVIGYLQGGTLECAYALGELSVTALSTGGQRHIGGCVGNVDGEMRACYHPNYLPTTGGMVHSLSALQEEAAYRDFDFLSVWTMRGRNSYPYPELCDVPMTDDFKEPVNTTTAWVSTAKPTTSFTYPSANVSTTEHTTTTQSSSVTQATAVVSAPSFDGWWILVVGGVLLAAGVVVCLVIVILKRK